MPALQNIALTDRAGTPVVHTFVPREVVDGVGSLVESNGVALGEPRFTISGRRSGAKFRSKISLTVPVVQSGVDDAGITRPVVVRTAYATVELVAMESSTTQERKDLIGMLASALGASALASPKTLVEETFVNQQGVWG
jgi:hypothetical protein